VSLQAGNQNAAARRSSGLLRVPFIRRCHLEFDNGASFEAFIVNINVLGAYVARDDLPRLGEAVTCRFQMPGNEREIAIRSAVAWINAKQQHPVHSLPPGFGIKFVELAPGDRRRIESFVEDYAARQGAGR
jgi:Tfp pilus assembly protein PilZ